MIISRLSPSAGKPKRVFASLVKLLPLPFSKGRGQGMGGPIF
jgi:hypothetical protein